MVDKYSSILDFPYPGLDPDIWKEDAVMRDEVKMFLMDSIYNTLKANDFKNVDKWVKVLKFVGSLTTYQYLPDSDADLHVEVDLPAFIEHERPDLTEQEAFELLDQVRKEFSVKKTLIPGTKHPVELYFETPFVQKASNTGSGEYHLATDKWASPPLSVKQDFDIEEMKPFLVDLAEEAASEVDLGVGKIRRHLKRIEELQDVIKAWPKDQRGLFEKKLQSRLAEVEEEIARLVKLRKEVVDKRKNYVPLSEQEITFKYLQRFGYLALLAQLRDILEQDNSIDEEDIPDVKEVVTSSIKAEKEEKENKLYIDFDDTIANNNGLDHGVGVLMEGVSEALNKLKEDGWEIVIYSCRANHEKGVDEIKDFLEEHKLPYDDIYVGKPQAEYYIDDRNIEFTTWEDVLGRVKHPTLDASSHFTIFKTAAIYAKYWIASDGKIYELDTSDAHESWVLEHKDFLKQKYGLSYPDRIWDEEDAGQIVTEDLLQNKGWIRVTDELSGDSDFAVELGSLANIPSALDNFIAEHFEGKGIEIDDQEGNYVKVTDPFPNIQKAVNKALKQPVAASKKEANEDIRDTLMCEEDQEKMEWLGEKETWECPKCHKKKWLTKEKAQVVVTSKKAEFMPSISTHAPVDYRSFDSDVIIPVDPDPVSDEQTYYAPHVDKPRKPSVWDKILTMFRLKKKDNKEEQDKKALLEHAYWVDPSGEVYTVRGSGDTTLSHYDWIRKKTEWLHEKYGLAKVNDGSEALDLYDAMIEQGWVRIGDASSPETWSVVVRDLQSIPSFVDEVLAGFVPEGSTIEVESLDKKDYVLVDWPVESLQQAVNRELSQKKLQPDYYQSRMWKKAKQWVTPKENRDLSDAWKYDQDIYNFINEFLADLTSSYLAMDLANYQPKIIIAEADLDKDIGVVYAEVHVDLVNKETGQKDAYLKLSFSSQITGGVNEEPEGPESWSNLQDPEIEILEHGKSDTLEKTTSSDSQKTYKPKTTWDDPNYDGEPFNALPRNIQWTTNDENLNWRFPWKFMRKPTGPYFSNMGDVIDILFKNKSKEKSSSKKLNLEADKFDDIVKLISETGGATYNFSKGNLAGTENYAVSIYPDRSVIIDHTPTKEDLSEYAKANNDLLGDSKNSLGVWASEGKVYVDVVVTIPDREEAMELGKQHNQISIFDLKNSEEIPTGGTGEVKQAVSKKKDTLEPNQIYTLKTDLKVYPKETGQEAELLEKGTKFRYLGSHGRYFKAIGEVKGQDYYRVRPSALREALASIKADSVLAKKSQTYTDKEMEQFYTEQHEYNDTPGGGNVYHDWNSTTTDFPQPKDMEPYQVRLDILEKPFNRRFPMGIPSYEVTWFTGMPASPYHGDY